jgi:hypothetical protein
MMRVGEVEGWGRAEGEAMKGFRRRQAIVWKRDIHRGWEGVESRACASKPGGGDGATAQHVT